MEASFLERLSDVSIHFTRDYMAKLYSNIENTKGDLQNQYVIMKGCFDSMLVSHIIQSNFVFV